MANLDSPKDGPTLSQRANEVEVKLVVGREHDAGVGQLLRVGPEQPRPGLRVRRKVMEEPESFVQEILFELVAGELDAVAPRSAGALQELEHSIGAFGIAA